MGLILFLKNKVSYHQMLLRTPQTMSSNKHSPGDSWVLGTQIILVGVRIGSHVFMVLTRTESLVWGGWAPNSVLLLPHFPWGPPQGRAIFGGLWAGRPQSANGAPHGAGVVDPSGWCLRPKLQGVWAPSALRVSNASWLWRWTQPPSCGAA